MEWMMNNFEISWKETRFCISFSLFSLTAREKLFLWKFRGGGAQTTGEGAQTPLAPPWLRHYSLGEYIH